MKKIGLFFIVLVVSLSFWFLYSEIYTSIALDVDHVEFVVKQGDSVQALANNLEEKHIIRHTWLFSKYLAWKKADRDIREGTFVVERPITLARVVAALKNPSVNERTITIIPGWDLRDIAEYFEKEGIASSTALYAVTGEPAYDYARVGAYAPQPFDDVRVLKDKTDYFGLEGYIAPDTYRVFKDASITDIVYKLVDERDLQFSEQMYTAIKASGRSVHEIMTMASILEREVRIKEDKTKVSDIFWKRHDAGMGLQADSTVHYAVGKEGELFTTPEDRDSLSPWNTYKYPGLPPGPICNPGLDSIMAAIYPEKNDYWYFLTTLDTGEVKYAKTLEEHNRNVQRYLR